MPPGDSLAVTWNIARSATVHQSLSSSEELDELLELEFEELLELEFEELFELELDELLLLELEELLLLEFDELFEFELDELLEFEFELEPSRGTQRPFLKSIQPSS